MNTVKQLSIDGTVWDGYRGDRNIVWSGFYTDTGYMREQFATVCKCGLWYGWIEDIDRAKALFKKMQKSGCAKCKDRKKKVAVKPEKKQKSQLQLF